MEADGNDPSTFFFKGFYLLREILSLQSLSAGGRAVGAERYAVFFREVWDVKRWKWDSS